MSKIHVDGIVPTRNTLVLTPETKVLTAQRTFFYGNRFTASATYEIPHRNVKWLQVWATRAAFIYLDGDSTDDPTDGSSTLFAPSGLYSDFHISANQVVVKNAHAGTWAIYIAYTLADEDE
jgi:hypothetical protein